MTLTRNSAKIKRPKTVKSKAPDLNKSCRTNGVSFRVAWDGATSGSGRWPAADAVLLFTGSQWSVGYQTAASVWCPAVPPLLSVQRLHDRTRRPLGAAVIVAWMLWGGTGDIAGRCHVWWAVLFPLDHVRMWLNWAFLRYPVKSFWQSAAACGLSGRAHRIPVMFAVISRVCA